MSLLSLEGYGESLALIDGDSNRTLSYRQLDDLCKKMRPALEFNLETADQDGKVMQDFDLEPLTAGGDYSQKGKEPPDISGYGSKDCVNLPSSTAVFRFNRGLIFLFCQNGIEDIIAYLGSLNAGHVVCLLDSRMNAAFQEEFIHIYHPHLIIGYRELTHHMYHKTCLPGISLHAYQLNDLKQGPVLHPELQLLLTTSGTTGNPKLIRLSRTNILSNARSIVQYLNITGAEIAIASLPFHYSYGLSVLHTHLYAGACVVLTQASVAQTAFWEVATKYHCTSLAGVPYTYKIMERIGFDRFIPPSLKTLTQAGGHLEVPLVLKYHTLMQERGGRFFVMYGQTEATARIAYLDPKFLPEKAGAIGQAIPEGHLEVYEQEREIDTPHEEGELVYKGPNVMLGYASTRKDLIKGDELRGVLRTGDIGYFDDEGVFFVSGRLKRISKIYGLRINLDDVEHALMAYGINMAAVTTTEANIIVTLEEADKKKYPECIEYLAKVYRLHPSTFICRFVFELPRTPSGKIDYQKLYHPLEDGI